MIDEGAVGVSGAADRDEELGDAGGVNGTSGDVSLISYFIRGRWRTCVDEAGAMQVSTFRLHHPSIGYYAV
jgi:hypothetical protein